MVESSSKRIKLYVGQNGKAPFEEWLYNLRDKVTKARIFARVDRLRFGYFGDCKSVGSGVLELRIQFGPGYRIYFVVVGADVVLLLLGGDKSSQWKDIQLAQKYWKGFKSG